MRGEIYRKLGVKTIINARGFTTALGGSLMPKEVLRAMEEAATAYVPIADLRAKVGEVIAKATGAEAGYVTTGAAGAILLATAACMAGTKVIDIERLPDSTGMKNEVIVQANHFIRYIFMVRMAGARIVTYGYINGPSWTTPEQLKGTINEKTAAIFHVEAFHRHNRGAMPLDKVLNVSKEMGIPVIVDAAPEPDLRKYIAMGADLVVYSGGKWVLGPQSTGIIAGRKHLIEACKAQDWNLGRPLKVSKEEMVGLITALELYMDRDWDAYYNAREARIERMRNALSDIPHVTTRILRKDERGAVICMLEIELNEESLEMTATEVNEKLVHLDPSVRVREYYAYLGRLEIEVDSLPEEHDEVLIQALRNVLTSGGSH
jgi:L-seryl-tRNA(Ser) seleniumtransferase/D-glucosaminate-6-phosphate ammonia-lyase